MKKDLTARPRFALRFLDWYCPASLREGIEGDLVEQFEVDIKLAGGKAARRRFVLNVIRFFRPGIIFRNKFSENRFQTYMLQNYFKTAFRSLWRAKAHSFINVFGLGLGIACCLLIALFVRDELTFDTFHTKADRIYRVYGREDWGEKKQFLYTVTPFPMGPALKENLAEVELQVRINNIGTQVKVGENQFSETVAVVGQDFFKVFDFEISSGKGDLALSEQSGVVLSERMAKKYFGMVNPIDKVISLQLGEMFENFSVKAVAKNPPTNSSIQFDILISDLNLPRLYSAQLLTSAWFNVIGETYVLLRAGTNVKAVESKFPSIFKTIIGEEEFNKSKYAPGLQPLTDIHLNVDYPSGIAPVSSPKYSYILAAIAILILFVACINFVTLSIGRSMLRAKEVGIRKVVGAIRSQLITQFIGEAIIVTLIALIVGIGLSMINLPLFNDLSGKQLLFPVNTFMLLVIGSLLMIIGLISGSYPAFVLSSFKPIAILKGSSQTIASRQGIRKILVGVQLVLSIFLISSTMLMREQLSYLQSKNMGFDKEQLAVVQLNAPRTGGLIKRIAAAFETATRFKTALAGFPDIVSTCASSHDFGNGAWIALGFTDDKKVYRTFNMNVVDDDYIRTLKIQLVSGRNFSADNPSDKRRAVIVNESFVKEYGWSDAIGKKIPGKNFQDHEIIGVVKDFNYASLYTKVQPLVIVEDPSIIFSGIENVNTDNSPIPKLMVRLKPGNMAAAIEQIKGVWNKISGGEEFSYSFVDQAIALQYRNDQNLGKIVSISTLLAIVIGSLGLYALASLAMQNRTKEISVRKVMGANEKSLLFLLSKEYVYLIGVCLLISVPITWYLMKSWLSTFEYRVGISFGVFLLSGGISLIIAMATISFQTLKTVWTNPVKSLKYE
jgi:putative ABC transport system permease protein